MFTKNSEIGIIGSGAMGSGIAQVAATAGHKVCIYDNNENALQKSELNLKNSLSKLLEKQKITAEQQTTVLANIHFVKDLKQLSSC